MQLQIDTGCPIDRHRTEHAAANQVTDVAAEVSVGACGQDVASSGTPDADVLRNELMKLELRVLAEGRVIAFVHLVGGQPRCDLGKLGSQQIAKKLPAGHRPPLDEHELVVDSSGLEQPVVVRRRSE